MSHPTVEKPVKLAIDVEQWKRDIQTFAETTTQALNAIAAELSNGCSNGRGSGSKKNDAEAGRQNGCVKPATLVASQSPSDDRLAKLKSQLAERISKSN